MLCNVCLLPLPEGKLAEARGTHFEVELHSKQTQKAGLALAEQRILVPSEDSRGGRGCEATLLHFTEGPK